MAVAQYRNGTFAISTSRTYRTHLKSYLDFCKILNISPVHISEQNIARYIAHLADRLSFSSIKQ